MVDSNDNKISIQEYFQLDATSEEKYEFHNGEVFAMAGGTLAHSKLISNINRLCGNAVSDKKKDCEVHSSELKVRIEAHNKFVYPDGMLICGDPEMYEDRDTVVTNPILIIEVLSESSERYDRGEKFRAYRTLSSFREYVMIDQYRPIVDVIYRHSDQEWHMVTTIGLDKQIYLHTLDTTIKMADIYFKVRNLKSGQEIASDEEE